MTKQILIDTPHQSLFLDRVVVSLSLQDGTVPLCPLLPEVVKRSVCTRVLYVCVSLSRHHLSVGTPHGTHHRRRA